MDPERFQHLMDIVGEAALLPAEERDHFLAGACGADSELLAAARALLARSTATPGATAGLIARVVGAAAAAGTVAIPERIGHYCILDTLGSGGMGVVYRALQEQPVRREVALKLIRSGIDVRAVARFHAEQQFLASMDHPNVPHVFDAGTTLDGAPYFAMELVDGAPITRYADDHRLGIDARLELLAGACRGVQHAHHKGIIHRDLKLSNILVTEIDGRATPKIIDFGIAKALTAEAGGAGETEYGALVGTLEYMSPEQAASDAGQIDTRTDVYSLGVVLYELATGALPFDSDTLRTSDPIEARRTFATPIRRRPGVSSPRPPTPRRSHTRAPPTSGRCGARSAATWNGSC